LGIDVPPGSGILNLSGGICVLNSVLILGGHTFSVLGLLGYLEDLLCLATLCFLLFRKQWADYATVGWYLATRLTANAVITGAEFLGGQYRQQAKAATLPQAHVFLKQAHIAYVVYFDVYWVSYVMESILSLIIVYSIFRLAMAPLKGLQALGMLVFRWAGGISVAVALGGAIGPHKDVGELLMAVISQFQRTQSILTLCLLLFVCFAIRPMGLSYSSRIFGVSLGLGIMATNDLVQSAWLAFNPSMSTSYQLINGIVAGVIFATWATYFALPEPRRRMIVLPTTSPFLRWNQISQALGDNPGFVAVGGIPPELFAPAELEVMRRASVKMVEPSVLQEIATFPPPPPQHLLNSTAV